MSASLDSKIEFKQLCNLFERIVKAKGARKFEELQSFTRECRNLARKIKAQNSDADTSLFPIFRLLLPTLERERGPYGLKTKSLESLYVRVFCLGKKSANADKLKNYKKPVDGASKTDDFAERVYWLLRNRLGTGDSSLTIQNVNKFLDDVASYNEANRSKDELFAHFTRNINAQELKWLTRILLKDLRLGLAQKKAFEAIHPNAENLFNVTSNLRQICERFEASKSDEDGSANSGPRIAIELFSHVKPMLLERLKIEQIGKLFAEDGQSYYAQIKFDGERSQLHFKEGRFKYFTRQGFDITGNRSYGEYAESGGFLTSSIAPLLHENCRSVILDGELMGWHKQRRSFGSKGLSFDVKKLTDKSYHQPCFVAYDVLLYNGESLIDKPYSKRLDLLSSVFEEKEGILVRAHTTSVSKVDQILELFNVSLDKDDEGIVLKKCDTLYKPNVREKSGCYKLKAEYSDGLIQDLDLIILGGYYGEGRCRGIVSSFLVGVASPPTNKNGLPSEFFSVVSVRSGLSDENLKLIQQKLRPHWKDKKPTGVFGPKTQPPDVWVSPKQSLVLQLRASEMITTQGYPLGYSLRFPRVLKIRDDKPWYNTCTTVEFKALVKDKKGVQKLTKRKASVKDIDDVADEVEPKLRKTSVLTSKVHDSFVCVKDREITRVSRLFEGKEFCVINGDIEIDKNEIARILQEHMARIVQNPGGDTFCILVGNPETLKAKTIISSNKYDVANLKWLRRATQPENIGTIQEFYPWELYSMSPSTIQKLEETYDQYFDSYIEDATEDSIKRVIEKAGEMMDRHCEIPELEKKKLDTLLFNSVSPFSIFRSIVGYFHNENDVEKYLFVFMNGTVSDKLCVNINYIFIDDDTSSEILHQYKLEVNDPSSKRFIPIIKSSWISGCFERRKLLSLDNYIL